jgi:pimeloyl-ACP methyl ester carboxylesterase
MSTWILLRGLTRESGHWGAFIEQFQRAMPQAQLLALDLPGNGALHRQTSPWCVADMVEHCRTQLVQRRVQPPYHVLAMSLGAMVAVAWSHAHPQELASQVLINTSMRPFNPFHQRLLPANYTALMRLAVLGATPGEWERQVLRLTSNHASDEVLAHWIKMRLEHPVSRANALRQLVAAARFRAPLARPPTPTLVLASERDHLVAAACSKAMAQHWQCELRVHPAAGHDLPLDDGPWVAAQLRTWLM